MPEIIKIIFVCLIAGAGAGIGTGFAGMSAAAVISPLLITFLDMPAYDAVGIALASDVLASAASAWTYKKNKNIDIKNGLVMMVCVLLFTMVGSYAASLVPNSTMGSFSVFMTMLLGIKFIVKPVNTTKEAMQAADPRKKLIGSVVCGCAVGFICGFVGAGGGMMMCRRHKRLYYGVYRLYRCVKPLCHRRRAKLDCSFTLHCLHTCFCSTFSKNCKQSKHKNPQSCHRHCACAAWRNNSCRKISLTHKMQ